MKKNMTNPSKKRLLFLCLSLALVAVCCITLVLVAVAGCFNSEEEVAPTAIAITNKPTSAIDVGTSINLSYTLTPSDATATVEWTSSNDDVATVSAYGQVNALTAGVTTITAKVKDTDLYDSFDLTVVRADPTVSDLLADLILDGVYSANTPEVERVSTDPDYAKLVTRRDALKIGESYTETFDNGDFLETKLYPLRTTDDAVKAYIGTDDAFEGSSGRVFTIDSTYPLSGAYLSGMQFVANAKYTIEMDYYVLEECNDYCFQFRSYSMGVESDVFVRLPSSTVGAGKLVADIVLKNYSDYEVMIFCGYDGGGKIAVDNIKITRQVASLSPSSEDFDMAQDVLLYSALNNATTISKEDFQIADGDEKSLKVVSTDANGGVEFALGGAVYAGVTYNVEFALKIVSLTGSLEVSLGNTVVLPNTAGFDGKICIDVTPEYDTNRLVIKASGAVEMYVDSLSVTEEQITLSMGSQEENSQDFSNDGGMEYTSMGVATISLTRGYLPFDGEGVGLRVEANNIYDGVIFAPELILGDYYEVTIYAREIYNAKNAILYVRLGEGAESECGQFGFKNFANYDGLTGKVTLVLKANATNLLEIFASADGLIFTLDNISVVHIPNHQQQNTENFDDYVSMNYSATRHATITLTDSAEEKPLASVDNALKVTTVNMYDGVSLATNGVISGEVYRLQFDLKVIGEELNGKFIYISLGGGKAVKFSPQYTWSTTSLYSNYSGHVSYVLTAGGNGLQMFCGESGGGFDFVIDNVSLEKIDLQEQSDFEENFDDLPNVGVISVGSSDIAIVEATDGNALLVEGKKENSGVMLRLPSGIQVGTTYLLTMDITILDGYQGLFSVQQYAKAKAFVFDSTDIVDGVICGSIPILVDSGNTYLIQIFTAQACSFIIDNISLTPSGIQLEDGTQEENTQNFQNNGGMKYSANNSATLDITADNLPQTGDGYGLYVKSYVKFGGVNFVTTQLEANKVYIIQFAINVIANDGSTLYVSFGGDNFKQLNLANTADKVTIILVCDKASTLLKLFSSKAGLEFVIDNVSVKEYEVEQTTYSSDTLGFASGTASVSSAFSVANSTNLQTTQTYTCTISDDGKAITLSTTDASTTAGVKIYAPFESNSANNFYTVSFQTDADFALNVAIYGTRNSTTGWHSVKVTPSNGQVTITLVGATWTDNGLFRITSANAGECEYTVTNLTIVVGVPTASEFSSADIGFSSVQNDYNGNMYVTANESTLTVASNSVDVVAQSGYGYAGVKVYIPNQSSSADKTYIVTFDVTFNGDVEHDFYVQIYGADSSSNDNWSTVSATVVDGKVTCTLSGVLYEKGVFRIMATNTQDANYTISNLVIAEASGS